MREPFALTHLLSSVLCKVPRWSWVKIWTPFAWNITSFFKLWHWCLLTRSRGMKWFIENCLIWKSLRDFETRIVFLYFPSPNKSNVPAQNNQVLRQQHFYMIGYTKRMRMSRNQNAKSVCCLFSFRYLSYASFIIRFLIATAEKLIKPIQQTNSLLWFLTVKRC